MIPDARFIYTDADHFCICDTDTGECFNSLLRFLAVQSSTDLAWVRWEPSDMYHYLYRDL